MANGQRPARTAQDVAQLESDNEFLHNENERLNNEVAVLTHDRSRLQIENAMLEGRARENLIKATRMETIIRQVSAGLVSALQEITQERELARTMRRQVQEDQLQEETGEAPSFLRRPVPDRNDTAPARPGQEVGRPAVQASPRVESDQDREDRLRGAAERVSRPMPPPAGRPGQVDPSHADKYFPANRYPTSPTTDEEELLKLAQQIPPK